MKRYQTASSVVAVLAAIGVFSPVNAADIYTNPSEAYVQPASAKVNWSGLYVGGQVGYGIASGQVTTLSTENFEAVPSRCWGDYTFNGEHGVDRNDPETPADKSDDTLLPSVLGISYEIFGATAEECPFSGEGAIVDEDTSDDVAHTAGFDPAVDAHSVTTKSNQDFSESGLIGGARAGFDQVFGQFLVGVLGGYNWSAIDAKEGEWFVGGRGGILLDPRVLAYGIVTWTSTEFGGQDYDGITYGAGLEYALNHKIFIGMEYTHTDYGSETLVNSPLLNVKSDLDEDRFMATLRLNLTKDLFGN